MYDLYILLDDISVKFDVIIPTETHQLHDPFMFKIQGYDSVYNYATLIMQMEALHLSKKQLITPQAQFT